MDFKSKIEENDTIEIINSKYINWEFFKNSTILVTGATGLIGTQIVKAILLANKKLNTNIKILALIRNKEKAVQKFGNNVINLYYIQQDITETLNISQKVDFIIHTANTTSSRDFVEHAVETIDSIYIGTKNILEFAKNNKVKSLIYLSSMEVYGKTDFNRVEPLTENDYGYLDLLNPRNSYPEGKRLAENLCNCYHNEYNVPVKIARLCQTIGACVPYTDNRVFAQFARNIVENKDIVLHTTGETTRSYCYITDTIVALLVLLEKGENGESYNVSNTETACSIKEMAQMLCNNFKSSNLVFDLENKNNNFYLEKIKLVLSTKKIEQLNWKAQISLEDMYKRLIKEFKNGTK